MGWNGYFLVGHNMTSYACIDEQEYFIRYFIILVGTGARSYFQI